jgi:hypothetical protein
MSMSVVAFSSIHVDLILFEADSCWLGYFRSILDHTKMITTVFVKVVGLHSDEQPEQVYTCLH